MHRWILVFKTSLTASFAHQSIFTVLNGPSRDFLRDVPLRLSATMFSKAALEGQQDRPADDACSLLLSCWIRRLFFHAWQRKSGHKAHLALLGLPRSQSNFLRHLFQTSSPGMAASEFFTYIHYTRLPGNVGHVSCSCKLRSKFA